MTVKIVVPTSGRRLEIAGVRAGLLFEDEVGRPLGRPEAGRASSGAANEARRHRASCQSW
jgi:hypothetical protein